MTLWVWLCWTMVCWHGALLSRFDCWQNSPRIIPASLPVSQPVIQPLAVTTCGSSSLSGSPSVSTLSPLTHLLQENVLIKYVVTIKYYIFIIYLYIFLKSSILFYFLNYGLCNPKNNLRANESESNQCALPPSPSPSNPTVPSSDWSGPCSPAANQRASSAGADAL